MTRSCVTLCAPSRERRNGGRAGAQGAPSRHGPAADRRATDLAAAGRGGAARAGGGRQPAGCPRFRRRHAPLPVRPAPDARAARARHRPGGPRGRRLDAAARQAPGRSPPAESAVHALDADRLRPAAGAAAPAGMARPATLPPRPGARAFPDRPGGGPHRPRRPADRRRSRLDPLRGGRCPARRPGRSHHAAERAGAPAPRRAGRARATARRAAPGDPGRSRGRARSKACGDRGLDPDGGRPGRRRPAAPRGRGAPGVRRARARAGERAARIGPAPGRPVRAGEVQPAHHRRGHAGGGDRGGDHHPGRAGGRAGSRAPGGPGAAAGAGAARRRAERDGGPAVTISAVRGGVVVVLATLALVAALALAPERRSVVVSVFLLVLGAVALRLLVRLVQLAHPPARVAELDSLGRMLALASASGVYVHNRLRPELRAIARELLFARLGIDLDAEPEAARVAVGPAVWDLIRPDREGPDGYESPGLPPPVLARIVADLEGVSQR